ncbi:hypothetical protein N2W52_001998 [Clostridium perfringens]|nr:hypothetical protein [Clostridium perfringens]MDK0983015.1 hypothetical protein [Clostridium perfringens]
MIKIERNKNTITIKTTKGLNEYLKEHIFFFNALSLLYDLESKCKQDFKTLKIRCFIGKSNKVNVYLTNLELEEGKELEYKTSYEFKFKGRIKCMDKKIDELIENIRKIKVLEWELIKNTTDFLVRVMEEDLRKYNKIRLTEFVNSHKELIFNRNILDNLYIKSGLKGSCSKWLDNYRRKRTLRFLTKKHIEDITKDIIRELKLLKTTNKKY